MSTHDHAQTTEDQRPAPQDAVPYPVDTASPIELVAHVEPTASSTEMLFQQADAAAATNEPGGEASSGPVLTGAANTDAAPRQGKYKTSLVTIEQEVDVPDVDWARNGTRKGASRTAGRLAALEQVALDDDAIALLANSILDLPRITDLTRDDYLTQVRVAGLVLGQAVGRLLGAGMSVLPVVNPRGGHVTRVPVKPVTSCYGSNGRMLAQAERTIDSFPVLRAAVLETVKNTLLLGGKYQESIVASGVMDPVLLRPTRTTLRAENVSFMALETPDGTTRSITSISVLWNTTDPDKLTNHILTAHFGAGALAHGLAVHQGPDVLDISDVVRENLRKAHREVVNTYWTKAADPDLGADHHDTLRIQQALSVPATLTLTVQGKGAAPRSYVEALGVLVRNTHINRENWAGAAEASDLASSVVAALVSQGLLSEHDQDLLVAATPQACDGALAAYGYTLGVEAAPLWRAVVLLAIFTRPEVRAAAKQPLREALSLEQIRQQRYAAVVAPLLDLPWRDSKARSAKQAYNAWQRSGALVKDMWEGPAWTPVFTDPAQLVTDTGRDATMTLTALGGVALIADRFLTSDAIAGVGDAGAVTMPYKVPTIDKLIGYLSRPANTEGREQLALAAGAFRADGESSSPWRAGERSERRQVLDTLRVANAKARAQGREDKIVPEPVYYETPAVTGGQLDARGLMVIADHDGALSAAHQGSRPAPARPISPEPVVLTPAEQIADARETLLAGLAGISTQLASLSALASQHGLQSLDGQTHSEALPAALNILTSLHGMQPVGPAAGDGLLIDDEADSLGDGMDGMDGMDGAGDEGATGQAQGELDDSAGELSLDDPLDDAAGDRDTDGGAVAGPDAQ